MDSPWSAEWQTTKRLSSGGQGNTFLVKASDGRTGVLKVLRHQTDPVLRARMFREVSALRIVEHCRVARLIDTNAGGGKGDIHLFLRISPSLLPLT
jgi:serine/threonine protein kinase